MCIVILKESTQIQVQYTASLSIADCGLEFQKFENNKRAAAVVNAVCILLTHTDRTKWGSTEYLYLSGLTGEMH